MGRKFPTKKRRTKPRAEALLIKPAPGHAEGKKATPEDSETEIQTIRQTRSGGVLLELGAKTKDKKAFCEVFRGILGEKAVVSSLEPKCTFENRYIDCLTVEEEVVEALKRDIPDLGDIRIGNQKTRGGNDWPL